MSDTFAALVDALMRCWKDWAADPAFCLEVHAPRIVASDDLYWLTGEERDVAQRLRDVLGPGEWERLPQYAARPEQRRIEAVEQRARRRNAEGARRRRARRFGLTLKALGARPDPELQELLLQYADARLYHCTPASQVRSIFDYGLLSRGAQIEHGVMSTQRGGIGAHRQFRLFECVVCSFEPLTGISKSPDEVVLTVDPVVVAMRDLFWIGGEAARPFADFDPSDESRDVGLLRNWLQSASARRDGPVLWPIRAEVWIPWRIDPRLISPA